MNALAADGAPGAEGTPGEGRPSLRHSWAVSCTDAFGRPYQLSITADRSPLQPGIGIKAPTGEFAYVDVDHTTDLIRALTEASRFLRGLGG